MFRQQIKKKVEWRLNTIYMWYTGCEKAIDKPFVVFIHIGLQYYFKIWVRFNIRDSFIYKTSKSKCNFDADTEK